MKNKLDIQETITSANFTTGFGPAEGGGFNMSLGAAETIKKSKKKKKNFMDYFLDLQKRKTGLENYGY